MLPSYLSSYLVQLIQIDPTPYTAWGVLGALVFVLIVFAGVGWRLFGTISSSFDTRDKTIIEFVDRQTASEHAYRRETTETMKEISKSIQDSQKDVASALREQSKAVELFFLTDRVSERISRRKGDPLPSKDELEAMIRGVLSEYKR